jgi:hypothetical protein
MKRSPFLFLASCSLGALLVSGLLLSSPSVLLEAGEVETSGLTPGTYLGGWGTTSSFMDEGVNCLIPGKDSVGTNAWQYKATLPGDNTSYLSDCFSLANGHSISFEFSFDFYNTDYSANASSNNSSAFDVYVFNAEGDAQLALLRIWSDAGGASNGNHSCELYGSDWTKYVSNSWIKGDATLASSFTIRFSKAALFESYVGGQEGLVRLDTSTNTYLADKAASFANVDKVYFRFGGDNGFTKGVNLRLKSLNGQPLTSSAGKITDTKAPSWNNEALASSIKANEAYTIPLTAYDEMSAVSYSYTYKGASFTGKDFTPTSSGTQTLVFHASDLVGNVADKTLSFEVVNSVSLPSITAVPTLTDKTLSYLTYESYGLPTYSESTGTVSLGLTMTNKDDSTVTPIVVPLNKAKTAFEYFVPLTFVAGHYELVYAVSNSAGTTLSEAIAVTYSLESTTAPDFVTPKGHSLVDFVPSGVRVRSNEAWQKSDFGTFDLSYGMDIKAIVPEKGSNGLDNTASCFEASFTNVDDPNRIFMFRVWNGYSGADRPTNVYLTTDGTNYDDITDTGWISRTVDGIVNQYHFAFTKTDYLLGERTGGLTKTDNTDTKLAAFFAAAPSWNYALSFDASKLNDSSEENLEYVITSINGQSLANTNGTITTMNDALLKAEASALEVQTGGSLSFSAYAKDVLLKDTPLSASVTKPDGTKEPLSLAGGKVDYLFANAGSYSVDFVTTGKNGKTITKSFAIVSKSSVAEVSVTLSGTYADTYDVGASMTILSATYSANVVVEKATIKVVDPQDQETLVSAGSSYTFLKPGIHKIVYYACDDATPTPNEKTLTLSVNVLDKSKPVLSCDLPASAVVGEKITLTITVNDDSPVDLSSVLTSPDGTKVTFSEKSYSFTSVLGTYSLAIRAEDAYGNVETLAKELIVKEAGATPGAGLNGGAIAGIVVGSVAVVGGGVALVLFLRHKKKAHV